MTDMQIKMLEDIAKSAAQSIRDVIAIQDLDANTAAVLSVIATHLQSAASDARRFAKSYAEVQRSVPASEPEHSHVGPIL